MVGFRIGERVWFETDDCAAASAINQIDSRDKAASRLG
jgi:hypothetical protein